MKQIITLLLVLLIVGNSKQNSYSINAFIKELQENGFYDVIYEIKASLGSDVAIEFCLEIFSSIHCEEVVKVYIPDSANPTGHSHKNLEDLIYNKEFLELLLKTMSLDEIKKMVNRLNAKYHLPREDNTK